MVDSELRLIAWNRLYVALFDYPPDFLYVGKPIEEVIRYNVQRGYGPRFPGSLEDSIRRRLDFLRHGNPYTYVREWRTGRVVQTQGARMPDGGFITTYTDITALKAAERELAATNESLEEKVAERTRMLLDLNRQLEEATRSKSRFLAAASHDLTQPLGASKLYLGALLEDLSGDEKQALAENAFNALSTAESLLKALLDISKLDSGVMQPDISNFPIQRLFDALYNEFSVMAQHKGLHLRIHKTDCGTRSDRNLLRSILQNFLSNAIRYTDEGSILVVCRRDGPDALRIEVQDSGRGIPADKLEAIFQEFQRLDHSGEGVGLGLAIGERMAELLGHRLQVRSRVGGGSTFSVTVPRVQVRDEPRPNRNAIPIKRRWLEGLRILCVDDDRKILDATRVVLERWGAEVRCLNSVQEYRDEADRPVSYEIVLMGYQLHDASNGLDLLNHYRAVSPAPFLGVLITAEQAPRGGALRFTGRVSVPGQAGRACQTPVGTAHGDACATAEGSGVLSCNRIRCVGAALAANDDDVVSDRRGVFSRASPLLQGGAFGQVEILGRQHRLGPVLTFSLRNISVRWALMVASVTDMIAAISLLGRPSRSRASTFSWAGVRDSSGLSAAVAGSSISSLISGNHISPSSTSWMTSAMRSISRLLGTKPLAPYCIALRTTALSS